MAGTALDLSGINVSQAVEKMSNQVLDAAKFDFQMKEKRRTEFMSDMELSELNQNLNLRNSRIGEKAINDHKNKWAGIYAEKNGRITDRDRLDMLQDKQKVEGIIHQLNTVQKAYEHSVQQIRFGSNSHMFDQDEHEKMSQDWYNGKPPPDGEFLVIRSANLRDLFSRTRRPQRLSSDGDHQIKGGKVVGVTRNIYADNEMRANAAVEILASNPMARRGAIDAFAALDDEKKQEYIKLSTETNIPPQTLYAIDIANETLWQDEVVDSSRDIRDTQGREIDVMKTIKTPIWEDAPRTIGNQGKQYQGYNMQHMGLSAPKGVLIEGEALNLDTGKNDTFDSSAEIVSYQYYDPKQEILIVRIKSDKPIEVPRLNDDGEQLYEIYELNDKGRRTGKSAPNLYTKEEADKLIADATADKTMLWGLITLENSKNYEIVAKTATRSGVPQTYEIDISNGKNRSVLPDELKKIMPNKAIRNTPRISVTPGSTI